MNAYLIHLIVQEQKKREKKQRLENTKKMIKNASGPDDVNYAMASGLSKADVDMDNIIHAIKRDFWN